MLIGRIENATRIMAEGQPEYLQLPIRDVVYDGTPCMLSVWEPTPDELDRLAKGAKIILSIVGTMHPPVAIGVGLAPE